MGQKGRFVVDDPSKYPGRDNEYVGGWAGGEAGLKAFVAAAKREQELNGTPAPAPKTGKAAREPQPIAKGNDTIYLGNGRTIKDDARKCVGGRRGQLPSMHLGSPGRALAHATPQLERARRAAARPGLLALRASPAHPCSSLLIPCRPAPHPHRPPDRYPGRTELTGGFAGGELGLKMFKEKGDIPIAPEGQGTKQSSPLITGFVLGLAATGGGLLLSTVEEVGVEAVEGSTKVSVLGLDEQTKLLITVRCGWGPRLLAPSGAETMRVALLAPALHALSASRCCCWR